MPCLEKHLKSLAFIALCSVWALSLPSEGSENKLTDLLIRAAITDILTLYCPIDKSTGLKHRLLPPYLKGQLAYSPILPKAEIKPK